MKNTTERAMAARLLLLLPLLPSFATASCPSGTLFATLSDVACTYANFQAGTASPLSAECAADLAAVGAEDVAALCRYDAPTQFVEVQKGSYQADKLYFKGGGELFDGPEDWELRAAEVARFDANLAGDTIVGYPEYFARVAYNQNNELGDNGYPANMNLEKSCQLQTMMCCFTQEGDESDFDSTTDVCRHDLASSPESNHIKNGWAAFPGKSEGVFSRQTETKTHCVGFTWTDDDAEPLGNMLYDISLRNTATKGHLRNIPGAPLCGCVEHMPQVESAACRTATVHDYEYLFSWDAELGALTASNVANVTYGDCDGDLAAEYAARHPDTPAAIGEHLVGDCDEDLREHLNEERFLREGKRSTRRFAIPDKVWEEVTVGEGSRFQPPDLDVSVTDTLFRNQINNNCGTGDNPRKCIIRRICDSCFSAPHQDIFYRRLTDLPPMGSNATLGEVIFIDTFMNNWFDNVNGVPFNVLNVDFTLHSSYADAEAGDNPWQFCNYNDPTVGFPRDCGPQGHVSHEWNSYAFRHNQAHANHNGYYVEKRRIDQPIRITPRVSSPIDEFFDLALEWARLSERGPTISGHFLVMMNIAMFDAWAAFEVGTKGIITDLDPIRTTAEENIQVHAMTDAAHDVMTRMGSTICDQAFLEADKGENAVEILAGLTDNADALRDQMFGLYALSPKEILVANAVSDAVVTAIMSHIVSDGSNYQNGYADTTGYACTPWCTPEPSVDDGISDYDFLNGDYTFNTFDAVAAKAHYGNTTPSMAVHPKILDGTLQLTETWQSLTQIGFFPDGGQKALTPHWGGVTPISMPNGGSSFRSEYVGPYDTDGNLRQEWIDETTELVDLGEQQQAGNNARGRAESEYWELGDSFVYPPGWWISRANDFCKDGDLDLQTTLQIMLGTSITVFDAGIAAWDMKFAFDSVRPFTAVNELFFGTMVSDWTGDSPGNKLANIDEENFWRPYQRKRNASPPFPDVPSGHSVFSTSASVVLRNLLRTNVFDFTTEPFVSRFDTKGGFDGDESNVNEEATLDFKTISQAADAAGYSRLLGGIHMMQGNVIGLEMGAKVGHSTLRFLRYAFGEDDLGLDPVEDVNTDIVFGTGKNDELLVAPCGVGPVEVYGLYGDDVLESAVGEECGVVSLFGGFGTDTFRIGGDDVKIQDYDSGELILLLREEGAVSYPVLDNGFHSVTMVYVDNVLVLELQGIWTESEINVRFESPGVRNSPRASNPIPYFVDLSLEWARLSERGPTISGHFMVMMNIAMFDAWAAFEQGTEGIFMDFGGLKTMAEKHVQVYAMTDAAYEVMTFMGNSICDQDFLEDVNLEFAVEILADLNGQALALKNGVMDDLGLSLEEIVEAKRVSTAVRDAILEHILVDGSNFQNKYSDTTGFTVTPWCTPEPTVDDGISDYDFLDGSYTFNTFDPVVAKDYYAGTTPAMAVHPLVLDGTLTLTETWQSLCQIGFFPGEKDGGAQVPLTPHWGGVMPISMPAGDSFRSVYIGPYDEYGNIRQEWIDETTELVDLGKRQQAGNNARSRAESEYWELGDSFVYPPGWWMSRANDFARSRDMDLKATLQLIVGTSVTVFDAGIAAWDMKYAFDSVRPFTAVNELFFGTMVSDWTGDSPGNKLANIDERNFWRPYQLRRNSSPPFPDVPSGHSVFSTSASVVLRNLLRTNVFDFVSEPFICRFDTDGGFDGDESNGNEEATLDFKTISQAADAAGYSRLLGGIHMMQGNVVGLEMGAKVGHSSLQFLRRIFGEDDLGLDPVEDVNTDIVSGTGKNDHLSAPCGVGPVEVYGLYGDDVLVSDVGIEENPYNTGHPDMDGFVGEIECGPVNLFGGFGTDEFQIGGNEKRTTIQDYESGELIFLHRERGYVSYALDNGLTPSTTVLVDNVPVVHLGGIWAASELNIQFPVSPTRKPTPPPQKFTGRSL